MVDNFLAVSGGLLNNKKCRIYTWNVPNNIMQRISQILVMPVQQTWCHFIYLGLPLAKEGIKSETWNKQIEKVRGKIQSWGMMWLNLVGITILIKVLLSVLPIYQFALISAPTSIHKQMELIIIGFLWPGGTGLQEVHFGLVGSSHPPFRIWRYIYPPSKFNKHSSWYKISLANAYWSGSVVRKILGQ